MKTGIIVYVPGESKSIEDLPMENLQAKKHDLGADKLSLATDMEEVIQNWLELTRKGMERIICKMAEVEDQACLRLTGQELRLCG